MHDLQFHWLEIKRFKIQHLFTPDIFTSVSQFNYKVSILHALETIRQIDWNFVM